MDTKIDSWKKWHSLVGRIIMLKTVLSIIPIYRMSCLSLLIRANSKLVKKMRHFFWQGMIKKKKGFNILGKDL